jgi:hypothetical protein
MCCSPARPSGCAALCVELGSNINLAMQDGCTPLLIATQRGRLNVVTCLVKELGADINQANEKGTTALYVSAMQGNLAVVQYLVKLGTRR